MNKHYTLLCLLLAASQLGAQVINWEHTYIEDTHSDYFGNIVQKPNGEYIAHFSSQEITNGPVKQYLMLLSEQGEILELDTSVQSYAAWPPPHLFPQANGKTQVIGFWETPDSNAMTRAYLTPGFTHVWQGAVAVQYPGVPVMLNDTTLVMAGEYGCGMAITKLGLSGYVHWDTVLVDPSPMGCVYDLYHHAAIEKTADGGVAIAATYQYSNGMQRLMVAKIAADGTVAWVQFFSDNLSNTKMRLAELDGFIYLADGTGIRKLDGQGNQVWRKFIDQLTNFTGNYLLTGMVADQVDGTLVGLFYKYNSAGDPQIRLMKISPDATVFWSRDFGLPNLTEESSTLLKTSDNGFLLAGKRFYGSASNFAVDALLIKTDSVGGVGYSILEGRVFKDGDEDCEFDAGELGYANKPIRVLYGPGEFYTMTDSLGDYQILLNEGQATVQLGGFEPFIQFCTESQVVDVGNMDTIAYHAGGSYVECPLMTVDIGVGILRPCSTSVYSIWYANEGNLPAEDVRIKLYLGDSLQMVSTSLPFTEPEAGVQEFWIGNVAAGAWGLFDVTALVSCGSQIGEEICTSISISPDSLCIWDPSFAADLPSIERTCNPVVNSYDPNDKLPLAGTPELIGLDSMLKFQIRFQNTGNDLAYDITIRDTLSQWLEPLSIEPGAASHPYTWELRHPGEVRFLFKNIQLPDSTSNEPASHGFIQYKIRQKPALPRGTLLQNRAGIFFDFNPPVMTNQTAQAVDYPDHPADVFLDICAGEVVDGSTILSDTAVVVTYFYPNFDSVVTTHLHVLPVFESVMDTVVPVGTNLGGTGIYGNQSVELHLTATNGCDSTVTANVYVQPGVFAENMLQGKQLVCEKTAYRYSLPPNPAAVFIWSVTGGVLISGQGSSEADILWDDLDTGFVAVAVVWNGDTVVLPSSLVEIFPNDLMLSFSGSSAVCFGSNAGGIDLTVSGSGSPFLVAWGNGSSSEDLTNLPAGLYAVTVEDRYGCRQNASFDIPSYPALQLQSALENVSCFGENDGSINLAVAGGMPGFTFIWSNGSLSEDLSDLPPGNYQVTVTDAVGCTAMAGFNLTSPPQLLVDFVLEQPMIGSANGLIEAMPSGGVPPYTLQWSNGASGGIIGGLEAGSYQVTITDGTGCQLVKTVELEGLTLADELLAKYRLAIQPNPVGEQFNVQFSLPAAMSVRMEVVNSLGQKLASIADNQPFAMGMHRISWPTEGLQSGVYLLVFSTQDGSIALRFFR